LDGKTVKAIMKRAIRDQKGQALILAIILLLVGGLVSASLLAYMGTGLITGEVYERRTAELYAADAGIEDAVWKMQHNVYIPTDGYNLTVNDKYVWVTVAPIDTELFLTNLLGIDPKNWVASDWVIIGRIPEPGKAEITISWNGSGNGFITDAGIWLDGTCSYVEDQAIPDDDIRDLYPDYTFKRESYRGGTGFIWTWEQQPTRPDSRNTPNSTLTFEFTPNYIPELGIAFTMMGRQNVGLSYYGEFSGGTITATATTYIGTATADIESQTTVVASVVGCTASRSFDIINWDIS